MLVEITKNDLTLKVQKKVFESDFKNAGWKLKKGAEKAPKMEKTIEDEWEQAINEEPVKVLPPNVDDMTAEELKLKARELGIKVERGGNIGSLRKAIKKVLNQ